MNKRLALVAAITAVAVPLAGAHATTGRPATRMGSTAPAGSFAAAAVRPDAQAASAFARLTHPTLRTAASTRAFSRHEPANVLRARQASGGVVVVISFGPTGDDAVPINDVNHDGAQEVLQARMSSSHPAVVVLSGATGRTLWTVANPGLMGAEYARVPGGAGVVLLYSSADGQGVPGPALDAGEWSFVVTAVDAATGRSLWTQSFPQAWAFSPVGGGAMTGVEPTALLARRGETPLLLMSNLAFGDALVSGGMAANPLLLDASTGDVVTAGPPAVSTDGWVYSQGIGDVDADGTDDVATITDGDTESLSVWSGATGRPLWSTTYSTGFIGNVGTSPDINGDKAPDLFVSIAGEGSGGTVQAVAGKSGTVIWQHAGDFAAPIGDVDHDGRSESRVVRFGQSMGYAVVNGKGKDLWHEVIASSYPLAMMPVSYPAGDVNGDGIMDIYLRYVDKEGLIGLPVAGAGSVLVDGATGRERRLPDLGVPLGDTADGRGADFYRATEVKGHLVTTVTDGRTAQVLWRRVIGGTAQRVIDSSVGLFGSPARRQIVTAVSFVDREQVLTQAGRNGAPGWSTSYPLSMDEGFEAASQR